MRQPMEPSHSVTRAPIRMAQPSNRAFLSVLIGELLEGGHGLTRALCWNAYSIRLKEVFLCVVGHPGGPGHGVTRLHGLTQEFPAGKIKPEG